jgi:hypothetical protein
MKSRFGCLILISAFSLLAFAGCTRRAPQSNVSMSIALPDAKNVDTKSRVQRDGTSTLTYQALRVNITGSGISPAIFYKWDAGGSATATAPSAISLSVPQGSARTIVVLGVLKDSSGNMYFQYGSTVVDLNAAAVDVSITLTALGGASSGEGKIMGQYLTSAGAGPTDIINIYFNPPGSLPPVLVEQSEMFNGFFSVFGLNNVNFTYTLGNGTTLFNNVNTSPTVGNPLLLQGTSSSVALAYVPDNFQWWGGGSAYERSPTTYIAGFFGPGVQTSNTVCYDPAGTVGGGYTDVTHETALQWTPSLTDIANGLAGILTGGLLKSTTPCSSAANEFNSYLYLRSANVDEGDNALNFRGPFEAQSNGYLAFSAASPMAVNWTFLPGTTSAIDGVEVFYSTAAAYTGANANNTDSFPFSNHNNGFYCDQLVSNGFQSAGVVYSGGNSLNLPAVITTATPVEVIACPFKKTGLLSRQLGGGFAYFQSGVAGSPNSSPPPPACDAAMTLTSVMTDYSSGSFTQPNVCTAQDTNLGGAGWQGITTNTSIGLGSYYWEYSVDTLASSAGVEFSIATPGVAAVLDQSSGSPASGAATFVWNPGNGGGLCWANGGWTGSCGVVIHQGDIIGFAVTVTAGTTQIWMSQNGSWIGSLPPTGSALMTLSAGTSINPAVLMTSPSGGPATQVTFITNQTLFHSALPAGFSLLP